MSQEFGTEAAGVDRAHVRRRAALSLMLGLMAACVFVSTASAASVYRISDTSADAQFSSTDETGCIVTDAYVYAANGAVKDGPGTPEPSPRAFISGQRFDACAGYQYLGGFTAAPALAPGALDVSGDLRTARLDLAGVSVIEDLSGLPVSLDVHVQWRAETDIQRSLARGTFRGPSLFMSHHTMGVFKYGVATGTVSAGGIEYAPGPSRQAVTGSTREGAVTISSGAVAANLPHLSSLGASGDPTVGSAGFYESGVHEEIDATQCTITNVGVDGLDSTAQAPGYGREESSRLLVVVNRFDYCVNTAQVIAFAEVPLEEDAVLISRRLTGGSANAVVETENHATGEPITLSVVLTWTPTGEVSRANEGSRQWFTGEETYVMRSRGAFRPARVAGVVSDGTTNFTSTSFAGYMGWFSRDATPVE